MCKANTRHAEARLSSFNATASTANICLRSTEPSDIVASGNKRRGCGHKVSGLEVPRHMAMKKACLKKNRDRDRTLRTGNLQVATDRQSERRNVFKLHQMLSACCIYICFTPVDLEAYRVQPWLTMTMNDGKMTRWCLHNSWWPCLLVALSVQSCRNVWPTSQKKSSNVETK